MDYGKLLSRAWQITWRWKVLWILGFLACIGKGFSTGGNSSYSTNQSEWGNRYGFQIPPEIVGVVAAVACLAVLIGIALWVISVMARGGLIAGVQQVEDQGSTGFLQAWRVGRTRFWTLFGIAVLAAIPTIILILLGIALLTLLILGTVGVFDTSEAGGILGIVASVLCGGTVCCGAILLGIVLDQIRIYAERAAILEGLGWIDAFKRGWQVLKENLGPTVILWLIFFVIGLIFGAVVLAGMAVVMAPFFVAFSGQQSGPSWLVLPVCGGGLLAIIAFSLIGSVVETFTSASWTLAYRQMTGPGTQRTTEPATE